MTRRGVLVRQIIPLELRRFAGKLAANLRIDQNHVQIRGSDGVGQKTPYCWTRIASDLHSPDPRHGWYLVFLFDAEGQGVYLSLNQGTTVWDGIGFNPQDPSVLAERVRWARSVLPEINETPRLKKQIQLGGRGPLGRAYEAGNVASFLYSSGQVPIGDQIDADIATLSKWLGSLYSADELGRAPGQRTPEEIATLDAASPRPVRKTRGQGRGLSSAERAAVEKHAMNIAAEYFCALGYEVRDTSVDQPYDLQVRKGEESIIVEVKGTTSLGEIIVITAGELRAQRRAHPNNALVVVHSIDLNRNGDKPEASGGTLAVTRPWAIVDNDLEPLAYSYQAQHAERRQT